jgi:long-chain acyl-CoA synthetase
MLVHGYLERSFSKCPSKTALIAGDQRLSYGDLESGANRLAQALLANGVRYADRVVVFLDNSPEAVISIFGILKAGAILVVLNPTTKAHKLAYVLGNCRATGLITHARKWAVAAEAAGKAPSLKTAIVAGEPVPSTGACAAGESGPPAILSWEAAQRGFPAERPPCPTIDIDLAALVYTSGTTGDPKGVMLTHANMVSASTSITTYLENREDDIILSALPLSFDYGLYQVLMAVQFGGTVVLERSFLYPYALINLLQKEGVTGFPIVPTMAAILLQMEDLKQQSFPHLRYVTSTSAALPSAHIRGLRALFPGARLYSMYGLTECKRVSYLPPEELDRRPTSVGKGMPNEQVCIVDEQGQVITSPGVVGELVVRGANVMKGYWELPAETAKVLRPGRRPGELVLYTGDLFKMDEDGYLYFVSRTDDIIKSRGEKVSPKEVENALCEHPQILEAVVVGVADETRGEAIKAHVVLRPGATLTAKQVIAHCRKHLEDFMVPAIVEFRDRLPRAATGKVIKTQL